MILDNWPQQPTKTAQQHRYYSKEQKHSLSQSVQLDKLIYQSSSLKVNFNQSSFLKFCVNFLDLSALAGILYQASQHNPAMERETKIVLR